MQENDKYITATTIKSTFGVSSSTLRNWATSGRVATIRFGGNGKRLYKKMDIEGCFKGYAPRTELGKEALAGSKRSKARVCYARVSSAPQRPDLERQIASLQKDYPNHEIIQDVASGINWKRPGLLGILDRALRGDVQEVVVAHRDRLCRFAFELIEHVLNQAGCKVVVQEQGDGKDAVVANAEGELKDDLLAILTVFVASNNGRRSAAHKRARRVQAVANNTSPSKETHEDSEEEEEEDTHQESTVAVVPDGRAKEGLAAMD